MAMTEQFSLRWNDFHSNLSQSFQALLEDEDLVDVTLAADGQHIQAHKLILSICSPYFKKLFKSSPCGHPIVILKDVTHQELRQLLQFMYKGEVHVRQHELQRFLHTAEILQIKGLTTNREQSESPPPSQAAATQTTVSEPENGSGPDWNLSDNATQSDSALPETPAVIVPVPAVKEEATRSPLKRLLKNTSTKNSHKVKKECRPANDSPTHCENVDIDYSLDSEPLIDFDNDMYYGLVLPESPKESGWNCKSGGVKCPSCHRFFANRYNLKVHIRDKHDTREGTLQCDICHKRMRNPSCLRVHMYHHRKQAAYLAQINTQGDPMRHLGEEIGRVKQPWPLEGTEDSNERITPAATITEPVKLKKENASENLKAEVKSEIVKKEPASSEGVNDEEAASDVEIKSTDQPTPIAH